MSQTRILLIRHGQSEWNASGRWQGWADPPLSSLGRRQAHGAAEFVGSIDAIVSSDLIRATETAVIISEAIGVGPVIVDERLRERDIGEWTGLTHAEIEEGWPGRLAMRPFHPPGGEHRDQVIERVLKGLSDVAISHRGGEVLVIAHGGVIRNLERHLGTDPATLPNLGGVELIFNKDQMILGERLLLLDPGKDITTTPYQL